MKSVLVRYNIDLAVANSDSRRRQLYKNTDSSFAWFVGGSGTANTTWNLTSFFGTTTLASSAKRFKLKQRPSTNALDVISRLEPFDYDYTHKFI